MKLLVPIDASDHAKRALQYAAQLANATGGSVHLLNVAEDYGEVDRVHAYHREEGLLAPVREKGAALIRDAEATLTAAGVPVTSEMLVGSVARTIAARARELGCDAIVMGTHGLGFLDNMLMGSTSRKVLALTDLPLTLVK
jgi:nucleotide-binding universal stress UspA family protein